MPTVDRMKVHILSNGAMGCDLAWLLLSPGRVMATRHEPDRPSTWFSCAIHTVLIEHPDGTILWDTAAPRDWETRWVPTGLHEYFPYDQVTEEQYLDSRLRQLNLEPGDIDTVVLSHLHFDHAGNAKAFQGTGARLVVHADERDGAFGIEGAFAGAHLKADYDGLEFETVKGDTELVPGVTLLEVPGHTWGTMALRVDLPDSGTLVFANDAIYMRESYGPPPVGAAIVWDNRKWLASVEKIRGIAERTGGTVIFGHDPEQLTQLRLAPDAHYT